MHVDKTRACAVHKTKSCAAPAGAMDDNLTFPIRKKILKTKWRTDGYHRKRCGFVES